MRSFALMVLLLLLLSNFSDRALAVEEASRQGEVALVWKEIVAQANDVNAQLDKKVIRTPEEEARHLVAQRINLIFDNGRLRPINDTDQNLAPNHYIEIIYQKNFNAKLWNIVAFDNQKSGREIGWVGERTEVTYSYRDDFEGGELAKSAKAYDHGRLIASAEAVEKLTETMPYRMDIKETQYSEPNHPTYEGTLRVELESFPLVGHIAIVKQNALSGKKILEIFYNWSGLMRPH